MFKQCISPPELDDRQLLLYLDGKGDQEVVSHLERCTYCLERANALADLQNRLTSRLYRTTCPSSMELGEYHLRMLPDPERLMIRHHIGECPHCTRELAQLEEFFSSDLALMESSLLGQAKVLIARLVGSLGEPGQTVAALRGEAKGPLTLQADGLVIVMDIQPVKESKVNILGQLAADDQDQWTGALVELHQGGKLESSSTVDDLGAFYSEGIIPGSKELRITSKDSSIRVISNIDLST